MKLKFHFIFLSLLLLGFQAFSNELHDAISEGSLEKVKEVLSRKTFDLNETDTKPDKFKRYLSPLSLAASKNLKEIVNYLLQEGADVNSTDKDGQTPLFVASNDGHSDVVKILLENKAKVDLTRNDGTTPLHAATFKGHDSIVELLLKNKLQTSGQVLQFKTEIAVFPKDNPFSELKGEQTNKRVKRKRENEETGAIKELKIDHTLTENKSDLNLYVDSTDSNGDTPLILAARAGKATLVKTLLEHNANVNFENKRRKTALDCAIENKDSSIATLLIKKGANLTLENLHIYPEKVPNLLSIAALNDFECNLKCELLKNEIIALYQWKSKLDDSKMSDFKMQSTCSYQSRSCSLQGSDFLPYSVKEIIGKKSLCDGPNCWNAALVASNILPYFRHSTRKEISFWTDSPYCKERQKGEAPRPGDLILIRSKPDQTEQHGFVYISDNITFTKNGLVSVMPYEFSSVKDVLKTYGLTNVNCMKVNSKSIPEECDTYANYFDCTSLPKDLDHLLSTDPDLTKIGDQLNDLERTLQEYSFPGTHPSCHKTYSDFVLSTDDQVSKISKLLETLLSKKNIAPLERLALKHILHSTDGVLEQLYTIHLTKGSKVNLTEYVKDLIPEYLESLDRLEER